MPSRSRRNTDDTSADLDRRGDRLVSAARDRVRADPLAAATGALCAALAAHWPGAAGAVALARWSEHDRRVVRSRDLPAGDPRCGRSALHPRRPAAVLDGDLAVVRPEHDPRAAARAARAAGA